MEYVIEVKRQKSPKEKPYFERFCVNTEPHTSVAAILRTLPVKWECGCLLQKCGACAMRINGMPKLACSQFLDDMRPGETKKDDKGRVIVKLEPLSKFPVISDLIVDRTFIQESLKAMKLWLEGIPEQARSTHEIRYQSSKCLQCGCCLEICPNFSIKGGFYGALSAVNAYRLLDESLITKKDDNSKIGMSHHGKVMSESYMIHYYSGCGKSLACREICPIDLPVDEMLVRSNAMAIWHRKKK